MLSRLATAMTAATVVPCREGVGVGLDQLCHSLVVSCFEVDDGDGPLHDRAEERGFDLCPYRFARE